jgi:hypothetical protein
MVEEKTLCQLCGKRYHESKWKQCYECKIKYVASGPDQPPPPQTEWPKETNNKDDAIALGQSINIVGKLMMRLWEGKNIEQCEAYEPLFKERVELLYQWIQELKKKNL